MNNASTVRELQPPAGLPGDVDGLFQRQSVVGSNFDYPFHVAAAHQLGDHVGLAFMLSQVEDSDDVRMGAETSHGLSAVFLVSGLA